MSTSSMQPSPLPKQALLESSELYKAIFSPPSPSITLPDTDAHNLKESSAPTLTSASTVPGTPASTVSGPSTFPGSSIVSNPPNKGRVSMKALEETYQFAVEKECTDLSKSIQMTVRGWADSVVGKKRMLVDALDSRIQERKAKISKLEATERDLEQSIGSKEKQVKRLQRKIGKFKSLLVIVEDLQKDLGCAEEKMEEMGAQHGRLDERVQETEAAREVLEESVSTLQEELLTLKETVGKVIRKL